MTKGVRKSKRSPEATPIQKHEHNIIASIVMDRGGIVKEDCMFKGYCVLENGTHMPPVTIDDAESAISYINLQKILFYEVKIVDSDDYIVLHAINKEIVFPTKEDCEREKKTDCASEED